MTIAQNQAPISLWKVKRLSALPLERVFLLCSRASNRIGPEKSRLERADDPVLKGQLPLGKEVCNRPPQELRRASNVALAGTELVYEIVQKKACYCRQKAAEARHAAQQMRHPQSAGISSLRLPRRLRTSPRDWTREILIWRPPSINNGPPEQPSVWRMNGP